MNITTTRMELLRVFKIGGHVIDEPSQLDQFISDLSMMNCRKIIVHGGGKIASEISSSLGIQPKIVDGRRVTDKASIHVVTMVYGGLVNKLIVSKLQATGTNALGLTGADAAAYRGTQRKPGAVDYGLVADVDTDNVDTSLLQLFLERGITPVLAPLTADKNGTLLNINADSVASVVATAMSKAYRTELVMCFEKDGVMADPEKHDSVIDQINISEIGNLIEKKIIHGGMIPKIENARKAVDKGVSKVLICNANKINTIDNTDKLTGTTIYA